MNRAFRGLIIGASIGLVGVVLALTPFYRSLETRVGLYVLFQLRGAQPAPEEVVIVAIDGQTGDKLGLPELPRDWPRSIHGQLIDELVRRGAAAIAFDMDFRRSRDEAQDQKLAKAIAAADRVVLFEHLDGRSKPIEDRSGVHRGSVWVEERQPPLPVLTDAARALGPFPLPKLDAAVDQFWTFKSSAQDAPTLPAAALQVYAMAVYDQWRELLARSAGLSLEGIAQSSADIRNVEQMRVMMLAVRALFERDEALALRVAQALSDGPHDAGSRAKRGLWDLYAGADSRYLNYYGPPGTITTVPYHAVLKGGDPNVDPAALDFNGKMVFVGHSDLFDPGQPDRFYTVFTRQDGVDLSGVEIAATAFANLLTGQPVRPLDAAATVLVLFGIGLILGTLVYLAPAVYGVTVAMGLAAAYVLAAQYSFITVQSWWPLVTPLLFQLPLALFIGLMAQYRLQHKRARHISEAIRAYVPEDVSRVLSAPGLDARSVDKVTYGTCLATDMAGFSTIAEKLGPAELAGFLNDYFDTLAQALKRHGVTVTEFRADAIMCAWTGADGDPTVRALPVRAALDAAQAVALFNLQRDLAGSLRVGLADGEFYVGHAGGGGRFVYSIVGDCANTASRIEGLNKHLGTQILASTSVLEGQRDLLVRYIGRFRFVGKSGALPIAEVLATRSGALASQLELCERFAKAQLAFERGEWALAVELFERLALEHPHDTPTRFLLARCKANLSANAANEEPGVITMSNK